MAEKKPDPAAPEAAQASLGTLDTQPAVNRKPVTRKLKDGTIRTDY